MAVRIGSNLDRFDDREEVREAREPAPPKHRRRAKKAYINLHYLLVLLWCAAMIFFLLLLHSKLSAVNLYNKRLDNDIAALNQENSVLKTRTESIADIQTVAERAAALGMVKPGKHQYVYLDLSNPEQVKILQKVTTLDKIWESLSEITESVSAYFK